MRKVAAIFAVVTALSGCVSYHKPVPEGYSGPRANLQDSVKTYGTSKADFFYVSHIDDKQIEDSMVKTRVANHGRGMIMTPVLVHRDVPAQALKLTITGRTAYAAPILTLTNTVYQVKGDVELKAEPGRTYVVRGELGENYSAVWIEELGKDVIVGTKVEVKGSAKLGVFEK